METFVEFKGQSIVLYFRSISVFIVKFTISKLIILWIYHRFIFMFPKTCKYLDSVERYDIQNTQLYRTKFWTRFMLLRQKVTLESELFQWSSSWNHIQNCYAQAGYIDTSLHDGVKTASTATWPHAKKFFVILSTTRDWKYLDSAAHYEIQTLNYIGVKIFKNI